MTSAWGEKRSNCFKGPDHFARDWRISCVVARRGGGGGRENDSSMPPPPSLLFSCHLPDFDVGRVGIVDLSEAKTGHAGPVVERISEDALLQGVAQVLPVLHVVRQVLLAPPAGRVVSAHAPAVCDVTHATARLVHESQRLGVQAPRDAQAEEFLEFANGLAHIVVATAGRRDVAVVPEEVLLERASCPGEGSYISLRETEGRRTRVSTPMWVMKFNRARGNS